MLRSMTGFGRSEIAEGERKVSVEIKSVNHRYLELGMKLPRKLNYIESDIRKELKKYVERGKVDIFISYENIGEGSARVVYNSFLAKEYYDCYKKISEELDIDNDVKAGQIMRCPDVITIEAGDDDAEVVKELVLLAVNKAGEELAKARADEGNNLKKDLLCKLDGMIENVDFIAEKSPVIVSEYKEKITERIKELLDDSQIDESRIAQEVIVFADKICVDEELVRLKSHIKAMRDELAKGGTVGRRLDFIAQEMNREANTTLSKTTDAEISQLAIQLKTDIEKIREQVQNIE